MFSKAQFESLIEEITGGMDDFAVKLNDVYPTAHNAVNHWYVPGPVKDAVLWLARESVEVGAKLIEFLVDLLKGAVAPVYMYFDSEAWQQVRGSATLVASTLSAHHLLVDDSDWSGSARDSYVGSVSGQSDAAARVGTIADSTSNLLLMAAAAGAVFYAALAFVIAKMIIAAIAALIAFGSVVFSPAGAAIILEEAGVNTAIIGTAVATLIAFISAQVNALVNLRGLAVDATAFPAGKWPVSNSGTFSDATVHDGDADWSLA